MRDDGGRWGTWDESSVVAAGARSLDRGHLYSVMC